MLWIVIHASAPPTWMRSFDVEKRNLEGRALDRRPVVAASSPGYTSGMKTAISLPDEVFAQAERLARRLKKSRSELYREAVAEYVARHDPEAITEAMNRVAELIDTRSDAFSVEAGRRLLEHTEW
jgi:predicted DNA-binding protein